MKKFVLIKVVTILLISMMVVLFATTVNAADDEGFNDLTNTLSNTGNTNTNNSNSSNNNTNKVANNTNKAVNNTNKTTNNSSVYNNTNSTNLPKTGIEDSIPVAMLVVVFGISAVYAYKKVNDYKNI